MIEKDKGRPTGTALVLLNSTSDAIRAKNELHMKYLGKRYIELSLCTELMYF
jgi:hypothetical protein